jgi:hypothetical protein
MSIWIIELGELIYYTPYNGPEVVRLTENGIDLSRKFKLADVISQGDYFHDFSRKRLYVYPNADIPGIFTPKGNNRTYVAYFWVCLSNVQSQDNPVIYIPQVGETYGATISCEYYPYLDANSENSVTINISQFYQDSVKMQFGNINATNGAFWYQYINQWIFKNGIFYIKVGKLGDLYADFTNVFAGKLSEPTFNDRGISIACQDIRYGILKSIPPEKFLESNHPDMDTEFIDNPIPILFGIKTGIKPVRISEYSITDQWVAGGGDFETWIDASTPYYWRPLTAGTSTVNRDGVNQRSGTYCARLDINASNQRAAVRSLADTAETWFDWADGIWLNPNCGYGLLFYYYNSLAGKTAKWALFVNIDSTTYYWDSSAKAWRTSGTIFYNSLPNVLSYTLYTEAFYLPETADMYSETATGIQNPLFFRFENDSAASSSIYIDDFKIISLAAYKISQTVFNDDFANRISLEAVDNVYKAGIEIFSPADYYAFLPGGVIVLTANPGSDEITCNAQGLKIEYDFTTGSLVSPNTFSENVADILYFVLHVLNQIPVSEIELIDFDDLQSTRTQRLGWYLRDLTETIEFVKLLQRTSIFYYIINVDGEHTVKYYRRSTTGNEIVFQNNDYTKYKFNAGTNSVFKTVIIKYAKSAMEDEYSVFSISDDRISYIYQEESTLNSDTGIVTALVAQSEVEAVAEFYMSLVERPPARVSISTINTQALDLIPTDKIRLNRSVIDSLDNEITIHEDEIYSIISRRSNLRSMTTDITAGLDTHLAGIAQYGDEDHIDSHIDHNDHTDSVHSDIPHTDTGHQDHNDHDDTPYSDSHADYTDYIDAHTDHTDAPAAHVDSYADHSDNLNEHTDTAYVDYTDHNDFHGDIPHTDGYADYTDHNDVHSDVPHVDSYL